MFDSTASGCEEWFDVPHLAKELHLTRQAIYSYIHSGELKAFRIGKTFRVRGPDFREFLASREVGNLSEQERFKFKIGQRPVATDDSEYERRARGEEVQVGK